jgi:hypothetical protein
MAKFRQRFPGHISSERRESYPFFGTVVLLFRSRRNDSNGNRRKIKRRAAHVVRASLPAYLFAEPSFRPENVGAARTANMDVASSV